MGTTCLLFLFGDRPGCGLFHVFPFYRIARNLLRTMPTRAINPVSTRLRHLAGSAPRSALSAEPPENELALAKNPFAEGARGRPRHFVPVHILDVAALVTDEVVVARAFGI